MKKLSIIGVLLGGALLAHGQTAPDQTRVLPSGPLINPAAAMSTWEIDYTYARDTAKNAPDGSAAPAPAEDLDPKLRKVIITHTNPMWHIESTNTKGKREEMWFDGHTQFTEAGGSPIVVSRIPGVTTPLDLDAKGYIGLDWISPDTFSQSQEAKGVTYLIFKQGDIMVWIDEKTRNPIMWRKGDETRVFRQQAPPTSMVTLPAAMARESAAVRHDKDRILKGRAPRTD
jgi:hypothetical protein